MKNPMFGPIARTLLGLSLLGNASAMISVTQTTSGIFDPSTTGGSFTIPYDVVNPGSVLVVGLYFDGGGGAASTVGFGTGTGDQAADGFLSETRTTLAYFLSPDDAGGLAIRGTSGNAAVTNAGFHIWELAGVDLSATVPSAVGTDGSTQITTTAPGSLVLDILGFNPFGGNIVTDPDGNSILQETLELDVNAGIGGGWLAVGQATPAAAGVHELGWDASTDGGLGDLREMAFAFTPVPEPSACLLLLGGVGVLAARRRRC